MWTNPAVQKTLSLLLLIGIGALLRSKLKGPDALGGVKVLILSIALPATIFIALLKIEIEAHLLFLPVLALAFNFIVLALMRPLLTVLGIEHDSAGGRTLKMLIPSLAPGLSCFPFLIEYLGEESLALAALADVGNKIFVLILLYLLAMHWYYQRATQSKGNGQKLKGLWLSLVREPVNLMIAAAMILLALGMNISALPVFMHDAISRMSGLMTPMILLFIGMAVTFRWEQMRMIFSLLAFRSGFAFLLSAILAFLMPGLTPVMILLAVVFPQSATSFWPYAHMAAIDRMEGTSPTKTFDTELALSVLACSLPFSTLLILAICSMGTFFTNPYVLLLTAGLLFTLAILPRINWKEKSAPQPEKREASVSQALKRDQA